MFAKFFKLMLHQGINLAPSKYEAWFITLAHTEEDIEYTIEAVGRAFKSLKMNKYTIVTREEIHSYLVFMFKTM